MRWRAPRTRWRVWGAKNSRCCCRTPTCLAPRYWPNACVWRSRRNDLFWAGRSYRSPSASALPRAVSTRWTALTSYWALPTSVSISPSRVVATAFASTTTASRALRPRLHNRYLPVPFLRRKNVLLFKLVLNRPGGLVDCILGVFHQLSGTFQHLVRDVRLGGKRIAEQRHVLAEIDAQRKRQDNANGKTCKKFLHGMCLPVMLES